MSQWSSSPEFDPRPVIEEFCDMPCQNKPDQFVDSPKLKPLNQLEMYLKYTKPWVQSRVVGGSGGGGDPICVLPLVVLGEGYPVHGLPRV